MNGEDRKGQVSQSQYRACSFRSCAAIQSFEIIGGFKGLELLVVSNPHERRDFLSLLYWHIECLMELCVTHLMY